MKHVLTILISLSLSFMVLASTDPEPDDHRIKRAEKIAQMINQVFVHYKNKEVESCKKVMESLSFELSKEVVKKVPKGATVDSLVFKNDSLSRWAYFKSVDLEYIRDLEAVITLKDINSNLILGKVEEILKKPNSSLVKETKDGWTVVKIEDKLGAQVIDDRFPVQTTSKLQRLFSYEISTNGEYLLIDLKESVPSIKLEHNYMVSETLQKK